MTEVLAAPARSLSAPAAARPPRRWWALVVIALAQLMVVLDATIVNIALPSAQRGLGIADADRQWVISAYTLAFGGLLLLGGRIADLVGRKRTFIVGLVGFACASAVGGAAAGPAMFFAARALQGAFGALLAPSALSLLTTTFTDPRERGRAFGVYSGLAVGGAAVGLLAGGVLTQYLTWRWCLYVNVPIATVAAVGAVLFLPSRQGARRGGIDAPGVLLGCGGLVALVEGLTLAESRGWHDRVVLAALVGGGALLVVFVLVEATVRAPLLPLGVLADRSRAGALAAVVLSAAAMFGVFLFLTYYLQVGRHYSPVRTGLAFLPMTAAIMVGSTQVGARLLPRVPARALIVPGLLAAAGGMAVLTRLGLHGGYTRQVLPAEILLGLGLGCVMMPAMSVATSRVAPEMAGAASAMVNTAQQVGGSVGIALLNTVATDATAAYAARHGASPAATLHGYATASLWGVGILCVAAAIVAVAVNARAQHAAPDDPGGRPAHPPGHGQGPGTPPDPAREFVPAAVPPCRDGAAAVVPGFAAVPGPGVAGRVTRAPGVSVAGATLTLADLTGRQCALAEAGPDGRYALEAPGPGTYVLVTSAPGHRPEAATLRIGDGPVGVDVSLTGANALTGTVRGAVDGRAVAHAVVLLIGGHGVVVASATTGPRGRYGFTGLLPGEYTLAVNHPAHAPAATPLTVGGGEAPTIHDVTLISRARIGGTVCTRDGRPVDDARVVLTDAAGTVIAATTTGPDGAYRFDDLLTGDYTVTASGYPPTPAAVSLTSCEPLEQDLLLGHGPLASAAGHLT